MIPLEDHSIERLVRVVAKLPPPSPLRMERSLIGRIFIPMLSTAARTLVAFRLNGVRVQTLIFFIHFHFRFRRNSNNVWIGLSVLLASNCVQQAL